MHSIIDVATIIDDVYADIDRKLVSSHEPVQNVLRRIVSWRGKGIRPVFMVLVGECFGGTWEDVRTAAVSVEAVHIASLIHDDIVDDSDLRRGEKTLNARYSSQTSVLFGDFVFIRALALADTIGDRRAQPIIFQAVERMVDGELAESMVGVDCSEETYFNIIADKTASFFGAAGELGAILTGADDDTCRNARKFGEQVGMAFQVVDDVLDLIGNTDETGKPRFMDIRSGRVTLPLIHAIQEMTPEERARLIRNFDDAQDIVSLEASIDYSYAVAERFVANARESLAKFPVTANSTVFDEFFRMIMRRTG